MKFTQLSSCLIQLCLQEVGSLDDIYENLEADSVGVGTCVEDGHWIVWVVFADVSEGLSRTAQVVRQLLGVIHSLSEGFFFDDAQTIERCVVEAVFSSVNLLQVRDDRLWPRSPDGLDFRPGEQNGHRVVWVVRFPSDAPRMSELTAISITQMGDS